MYSDSRPGGGGVDGGRVGATASAAAANLANSVGSKPPHLSPSPGKACPGRPLGAPSRRGRPAAVDGVELAMVAAAAANAAAAVAALGEGVGGKRHPPRAGVVAKNGVVAMAGAAAKVRDLTWDAEAVGEGSSELISSMHKGWMKPPRLRNKLPSPLPWATPRLGAGSASSLLLSTHRLSARLIKLRLTGRLTGTMTYPCPCNLTSHKSLKRWSCSNSETLA
mmetsp:Transcript_50906/g.128431  ORF Transcript_50906/g.128431 Transcript_50906/m.128431 type:complete len:222 (-) Transcript_50906:831-1496(-)